MTVHSFVTSFTNKSNTKLFFASCFEELVATDVVAAVTKAVGASVGGVDSDSGVVSFDVWLFFFSRLEERVATAVSDTSNEAAGASVGDVDYASSVGSFDVGGTAVSAGSLSFDYDAYVSVGTFLLDIFSFRCSRRLTVFIFVEVKAITKICEPNLSRKRLPDASTSRNMLAMYAFFPLRL